MTKYCAQIDENNTVTRVMVSDSIEWCKKSFGGNWILIEETQEINNPVPSEDRNWEYFEESGTFRLKKPYNSWIWDNENWCWNAPVEHPDDTNTYIWSENFTNWIQI